MNRKAAPERLGDLEAEVMRVMWELDEATVQDVQCALAPTRASAYTTLMTVMTRLAAKGVLTRRKEGRAYVYAAALEQATVAGSLLESLVGRVFGGSSTRAIAQLLETDAAVDDAELERLEQLIRAKREARSK
jgi:predicted transcriptional regulator